MCVYNTVYVGMIYDYFTRDDDKHWYVVIMVSLLLLLRRGEVSSESSAMAVGGGRVERNFVANNALCQSLKTFCI